MIDLSYTARNVLIGASLLGVAGGALGSFALMRRQSLLGDALAHAALPGVCLGYLLTQSKSPLPLFAGALVTGLLGALTIVGITRVSRVKQDAAIGLVLSVFFGLGIVLLTWIQKLPHGNQSGLDKYLFGQAATLMVRDLQVMALLTLVVLAITIALFKELELLCFDREYASSIGLPMRSLDILLTTMLVVVVVVGLQTVGVVLIVATLITPAAAARQWTESFRRMILLAALIGGLSGGAGALISATVAHAPTGPVIVLCSSVLLVGSLLFAPGRGLIGSLVARRRVAHRIRRENLLKDLYLWGERRSERWDLSVPRAFVMGMRGQSGGQLARTARRLRSGGLLDSETEGLRLTDDGLIEARSVVRKHRLWELYLTRRLDLPSDHVHRDADTMEHALTDETAAYLDRILGHPGTDPHGRPIPPGAPS